MTSPSDGRMPAERERDGDQQPADHHERDHVTDPVHQRLVRDAALLAATVPPRRRHPRSRRRTAAVPAPGSPPYTGALCTRSISCSGWWIPSATPTTRTRLPTKRLRSTSLSAAMMMPSAPADIVVIQDVFSPDGALGLHLHVDAERLAAACASFSAAMYVWAMPVGHAVTASSFSRCSLVPPPVGGSGRTGHVGLLAFVPRVVSRTPRKHDQMSGSRASALTCADRTQKQERRRPAHPRRDTADRSGPRPWPAPHRTARRGRGSPGRSV